MRGGDKGKRKAWDEFFGFFLFAFSSSDDENWRMKSFSIWRFRIMKIFAQNFFPFWIFQFSTLLVEWNDFLPLARASYDLQQLYLPTEFEIFSTFSHFLRSIVFFSRHLFVLLRKHIWYTFLGNSLPLLK